MAEILQRLHGTDYRSTGQIDKVARQIIKKPTLTY